MRGDFAAAVADHERALALEPDDPATHNYLAWILATCSDPAVVNGPRAVGHAERCNELTDWEKPGLIDTLATSYAAAGRFEDAVKWARIAVEKATADSREEFERRLALFEAGQVYRERN